MKHYALQTEYDGSCFHGWQEQKNAPSVQESLRLAWYALSGEDCHFRGSSRTDAGVSASRHVCDFFTESRIPEEKIALAFNTKLPEGLTAVIAKSVPEEFDARRDPVGKLYLYRFWISPVRPSLGRHQLTHCPVSPDLAQMNRLAEQLEGEHDFTAFMDQGSVLRNPVRRLDYLRVSGEVPLLTMFCLGEGFLYHQVRILAGTLYRHGIGKLSAEEILRARREKDRPALGPTMPASGLTLERVYYEHELFGGDSREDYRDLSTKGAAHYLRSRG